MNVEIETEAVQFPEKEYINGIFVAVCTVSREILQPSQLMEGLTGILYLNQTMDSG
jgi:hypothetical protein